MAPKPDSSCSSWRCEVRGVYSHQPGISRHCDRYNPMGRALRRCSRSGAKCWLQRFFCSLMTWALIKDTTEMYRIRSFEDGPSSARPMCTRGAQRSNFLSSRRKRAWALCRTMIQKDRASNWWVSCLIQCFLWKKLWQKCAAPCDGNSQHFSEPGECSTLQRWWYSLR